MTKRQTSQAASSRTAASKIALPMAGPSRWDEYSAGKEIPNERPTPSDEVPASSDSEQSAPILTYRDRQGRATVPQGLKPAIDAPLTARLKPCPFKTAFMEPVPDRKAISSRRSSVAGFARSVLRSACALRNRVDGKFRTHLWGKCAHEWGTRRPQASLHAPAVRRRLADLLGRLDLL
jgi:hypothetical protein